MTFQGRAARLFLAPCIFFLLLASQSSALPDGQEHDFRSAKIEWKALEEFPAICVAEYSDRQLLVHCAKIDLTAPGLKIKMLPQKENPQRAFYAEDFCKKSGAALAFNTTPFYALGNGSQKKSAAGLCLNDGEIFSKAISGYCALAFFGFDGKSATSSRSAKIFSSQKDKEISAANFAAGGFWQILKDGKKSTFKALRDSRTAVGLDKSGRTLFVMAVEGENPSKSKGLTYMECADFFLALGCSDAMQFDGGSSTQLCVRGKSVLSYKNYVKVPALIAFCFD